MKTIYILTSLLLLHIGLFAQGIDFEKGNLASVLKKAKLENKMVFIDAYAVWCGPCKRMDITVFNDEEVGQYFKQHIVALKVDVERGEGISIKNKYAIEGLPGYVFLDSEGNVVFRDKGAKPKAAFMEVVKKAFLSMKDPNSVGRMAALYEQSKDDEIFLSLYLQKLYEGRSTGYTDVLEHYLTIQKSIPADSPEMAKLIDHHNLVVIYGGMADEIVRENLKTEGWQRYVRKDVRERFQNLPKKMGQTTVDYAVSKRDSSFVDVALERSREVGMKVVENQRLALMMYYYKNTGMGQEFKALFLPQVEALYGTLDVDGLYQQHLNTIKKFEMDSLKVFRTNAIIQADKLQSMTREFAQFADTDLDKTNVLKWAKTVYDLTKDKPEALSFYASALYLYGDSAEGRKLKNEAYQKLKGTAMEAAIAADYALMEKDELISL